MHNPFPKRNQPSTRNLPKQNNHLHVINPNAINRPHTIHPNKTVGAVPVCPPERPRSGVSIPKTHALCAGMDDGCALAGRHGRAHRHRPYQTPSCFSVQSAHNQWPLRPQAINRTKPINRIIRLRGGRNTRTTERRRCTAGTHPIWISPCCNQCNCRSERPTNSGRCCHRLATSLRCCENPKRGNIRWHQEKISCC